MIADKKKFAFNPEGKGQYRGYPPTIIARSTTFKLNLCRGKIRRCGSQVLWFQ
jgi:hypothetical protein